ncbi:MAG: HEAT repeat domain-containing protein [Verrucomicrobiota bacterium]
MAAAVVVGCSKTEEVPPEPVTPPVKQAVPPKPVGTTMPKPAPVTAKPNTPPVSRPAGLLPAPLTPADAAREVAALEAGYIANPDFSKRVEAIYKISDLATPEAITVLGRLFHMEKDPDLKIEVIDSLSDIDEMDDRKIAILTAAAGADQPKDVRESAIDGLGDLEPKYALPILQSLVNDSDEDIRDAAKDQIEQLQAEQALQKP